MSGSISRAIVNLNKGILAVYKAMDEVSHKCMLIETEIVKVRIRRRELGQSVIP